ncbi:MAG: YgiQ family radical SAM protein [Lachnospiraceae bacterium]|nr:YgiQ family radical SAM protein [Lachnospiraceae bacterium]
MGDFLPLCREDMERRGWEQPDFVYVTGDAYVDHPSFGTAIISRLLESRGYRVAILSQPDWKNEDAVREFGRPRLGFLVSSGNMDSMVNHYTVAKKRRKTDAYTPGGVMGRRPDYAVVVYCNMIRRVYKDVPIIIGGIEASLRRMAHYDYWSDRLKRSVLMDSSADLLCYGMGEHSTVEIADCLASGMSVKDITFVRGTVYRTSKPELFEDGLMLPSFEELQQDKKKYAESFYTQYRNTDPFSGKKLVEPYPNKQYLVQNPPAYPLTQMEMDDIYALPYMRTWHPSYAAAGGVPAIEEVQFSLVNNRGCFGGCSFCALTFHQGRIVQCRSHESILKEAGIMTQHPEFKGYIHDVGGPTADFRHPACEKQLKKGVCSDKQCLFPAPCKNLRADHRDYQELLRKLRKLPGVKKVFIRSGIRFDYVLADTKSNFMEELCRYHVSGQLKVAPEHVSDQVLKYMGKPSNQVYRRFAENYRSMNEKLHKKQYLVPYLMSSHPGSTLKEAVELAEAVRDMGYMPEQVQDFYPTPSTISTCMYYTGLDPRTMEKVYIPRNPHEKAMQRALVQYRNPDNYDLVKEALIKAGRTDLIGFGPECLIRPRKPGEKKQESAHGSRAGQKHSGRQAAAGGRGTGKGSRTERKTGNRTGKKK